MASLSYPTDLKYAKSDEWVRIEGDVATTGLSDYAQDALNDIVFVEFTVSVGDEISAGTTFASVESVKAASDIYAHISGTVTELNQTLVDAPETINSEPYSGGWMVKIKLDGEADLSGLMDAAAYEAYCQDR